MLDMSQIGQDKEALLAELRMAGAVIKNDRGNVPCPYHGGSDSGSIHQGEDGRWRFKCFACDARGDVLDLQALREGKDLKEVIKANDPDPHTPPKRRPSPAPTENHPAPKQEEKKYRTYDSLDLLKQAVAYTDAKRIADKFPDFVGRRVITRTFPYSDPVTGHMDLIVFRLEGNWEEGEGTPARKSIMQGRQNAEGKFEMRRAPGLAPLFNRKRLLSANTVVVVEGEPKVAVLTALGFTATCSAGGSNAADKSDWSPLNGKQLVIIWRDKDKINKLGRRPGLDYQNAVIALLRALPNPPMVKIVDVDSIDILPENGSDVVDLVKTMGELPNAQKRDVIQQYLDNALSTGAHGLLRTETEQVLHGERNVIDWPWKMLADYTEALAAGTLTVICGAPGSSKSLFLLQAFIEWHKLGIPISVLELEDLSVDMETGFTFPVFHLRRAAAMCANNSSLTSLRWQREHPVETKLAMSNDFLGGFGRCLHSLPHGTPPTVDNLLRWVKTEVARGVRIVAIDPVTLADFGRDLHSEDAKLVRGIKNIIEGSNASVIAITHPRPGARTKTLDDFALTRDWGRHTQSAIWYDYVKETSKNVNVHTVTGKMLSQETYNRVIHIKKARNTGGQSAKLAYFFDKHTLKVSEVGEVVD